MNKGLTRGLLLFIGAILLLAFLFPYQPKAKNLNELTFDTQSNSELFFTNTRAFYYDLEDMSEAGFKVYHFGNLLAADTVAYINFYIVHNWRQSEAYIMIEPSALLAAKDSFSIQTKDTAIGISLSQMNNANHYRVGAIIFQSLLDKSPVFLNNTNQNIFGTANNEQQNFKVLKDYFKLIGKYN